MSYRCPVHKYRRFRSNPGEKKQDLYRCMNCTHYLVGKKMIIGRESICWNCSKEFTITEKSLQLKPHCGCKGIKTKEIKPKNELLELLMEKLG